MKRFSAWVAALLLALSVLPGAGAETMQDCHRVALDKHDTTQDNKSVVRVWTADTVLDSVDAELAALTQGFVDKLAPGLEKPSNKTSKNSRLDVEIRYSRTGLTWLSFLVQARTTYHRELIGQEIAARTYDMTTGDQVAMTDLFDADSAGWDLLAQAVRDQAGAYFPDETPDAAALDSLTTREALEQTAFTLHGMSLVLHIPAQTLYPERRTLMEITLMYPDIRPAMTEKAQTETDNLTYYKTCALTFDDGPNRTNTSLTLNALMQGGARGTFFLIGNRIQENDDLVQREHDEGHAIGAHNWHHGNVKKSSAASLRAMVKKFDKALIKAVGIPSRYDRVPYGLYPQMIKAKTGWPLIQWSVDTYDWRGRPAAGVAATVKDLIGDGDIILCHDIKPNTPDAVDAIVPYLEEKGYLLLTVDELFAKDGVTLAPDKVYFRCAEGDTSKKDRE